MKKHFIVIIKYLILFEELEKFVPEHRNYLSKGYSSGMILASGPQNPKTGGVIITRANSIEELKMFFSNDPFLLNQVAEYSYIEFQPVKFQESFESWFKS